MRLWSIHPKYLDAKGLVALWRETLLAKNVLEGNTNGYRNHPQLLRFKSTDNSLDAINFYLEFIWEESKTRGYNFDKSKFIKVTDINPINVNSGQVQHETKHLLNKLKHRDIEMYKKLKSTSQVAVHALFTIVEGGIENWEIV